ncbi:MAG: hypothetical protein R3F60_29600 [bacterium]
MIAALASACGASAPAVRASPAVDFRVSVDADLRLLTVERCFGQVPPALMPGVAAGRDLVRDVVRVRPGTPDQALTLEGGVLPLEGRVEPGDCVRLRFDAPALARASRAGTFSDALVLWPALWLWRSVQPADGWSATLRFDLPPGVVASAPWPADAAGLRTLGVGALRTPSRVVIGRFPLLIQQVAGSRIEVAAVGEAPPTATLVPWVEGAARGVAAVFGGFPRPHAQVVLLGQPGRGVVFGEAQRGGGPSVTLWLGGDSTPADLRDDWTLSHELFHLGMPPIRREDAWLSEGVTQYYTHVCQARAGVVTPQHAWDDLHDGFERGRASDGGLSVQAESAALRQRHAYWWVYWGGAAWALLLDLELRRQGDSLDRVLRGWQRLPCCEGESHAADSLLAEADALIGRPLARPLFDRLLTAPGFPSLEATRAALGLRTRSRQVVGFDDAAPEAGLRRAITAPP